jgi:hypothetical protein
MTTYERRQVRKLPLWLHAGGVLSSAALAVFATSGGALAAGVWALFQRRLA